MDQVAIGSYVGDGSAKNIQLGWIPDAVRVINVTDSDAMWEWFRGMAAGTAVKTSAAVAALAANAITLYEGTQAGNKPGFTVGTDLSENGKTHYYIAYRNER